MIVKLCGTDLLKLVNGEPVPIGDNCIVQSGDNITESSVYHETNASAEKYRADALGRSTDAEVVRQRRSNARRRITGKPKPKKTGQRWMRALFSGYCNQRGCDHYIHRGDLLFRNHDTGMNFCEAHGDSAVPVPDELQDLVSTTRRR